MLATEVSEEGSVRKLGEVECSNVARGFLFILDASKSPGGLVEIPLDGPHSQSFQFGRSGTGPENMHA